MHSNTKIVDKNNEVFTSSKLNTEGRKNYVMLDNIAGKKSEVINNVLENSHNIDGELDGKTTKQELIKEKQAEDLKDGLKLNTEEHKNNVLLDDIAEKILK